MPTLFYNPKDIDVANFTTANIIDTIKEMSSKYSPLIDTLTCMFMHKRQHLHSIITLHTKRYHQQPSTSLYYTIGILSKVLYADTLSQENGIIADQSNIIQLDLDAPHSEDYYSFKFAYMSFAYLPFLSAFYNEYSDTIKDIELCEKCANKRVSTLLV